MCQVIEICQDRGICKYFLTGLKEHTVPGRGRTTRPRDNYQAQREVPGQERSTRPMSIMKNAALADHIFQ